MTKSFFGCAYSDGWASPPDWRTTTSKKSLEKNWYVQFNFIDPANPRKDRKGFQWRKKVNKIDDLDDRKAAIAFLLQEMSDDLKKGYNPITETFMVPQNEIKPQEGFISITKNTPFNKALSFAWEMHTCNPDTKKDIKSVLAYFNSSCIMLKMNTIPVCDIRGYHIRQAMDNMKHVKKGFTDKRYNKYVAFLSTLFEALAADGFIEFNPLHKFKKKPTITEPRKTLTVKERILVNNHLIANYPRFWLFTTIFFHSGGREIELLNIKYEDVDLDKLQYKTIVRKGGRSKWVSRPIKKIAVPYWEKALTGAKNGDILFSEGLLPGDKIIRRDQITRRWRTHVKDKLGIEADFYALKHSNLDEIAEHTSLATAARAAGHTSVEMVTKHYAVGEADRLNKRIQEMTNEFAPSAIITQ